MLILINFDTAADVIEAIEAGAAGYLLKDAAPQHITAGSGQPLRDRARALGRDQAVRAHAATLGPERP